MITDNYENLKNYQSVLPFAGEILKYLGSVNIFLLEPGKYQIAGDAVYVLIQEYQTKPESEKKWESHKKYIDIQIVLQGREYISYSPSTALTIKDNYNEQKDVIIYENDFNDQCKLFLPEDYFSIFFPGEAHKPGFHILNESTVKKAVVKVLAEQKLV
ncbi:MAG TPA: YhcH/YjgK/YiaL family protein [Cyclobacteriaceae bacterium]|nr:YhcH/YjgK/YiaL family protein [Cyclobacteriaceae bacterium]